MTNEDSLLSKAEAGFQPIGVDAELKDKALRNLDSWLSEEQFHEALPQLEYLIETERWGALFDAFFQQIPFGTGGRRGPVGYGTNRINPFTIATSIQGHCQFLKNHADDPSALSVVIAYDVRCFQDLRQVYDPGRPNPLLGKTSRDFARIAACVYAANGVRPWFPEPGPGRYVSTPELSFAIRHLGAQGGLNISASHNHPDDNGAKIYNAWGSQEIPPRDDEMARIVESIRTARLHDWDEAVDGELIRWIPAAVHDAYIETNLKVTRTPSARSARIVFTPLHGTGWSSVGTTLERAGFDVECFAGQAEPDGAFPGVPFRSPNPEVRESLEDATQHARETGADLVLAADPDADRLGMTVPGPGGDWTFLNGNQIGTLLVSYLLREGGDSGARTSRFAATTVVTTSLFRRIAESSGVQTVSDLCIGFKYIADILNQVEDRGVYGDLEATIDDFVLGIEESHGYLVTPAVRDKDAAGAGLLLAELVSILKARGQSVVGYLDDVYLEHGYVSNVLISTVMQGARGFINIRAIQESLRKDPPERVGPLRVERFTDRWDETGEFGPITSSTDRAARDLLTFELDKGAHVILRPSGTESKNKIYAEVCGEPLGAGATAEDLAREKATVDARARRLAQDFALGMLRRIGVELPRFALEVSDLVPLEYKQDFGKTFLPELLLKLSAGETGPDVEEWIDQNLSHYGADGRLLVRSGIQAFCEQEDPSPEIRRQLEDFFNSTVRS
ncbi:MAG: phospho-sugar mutase [Planctomycetota bacterium]|nr:phospho-sugar mutase [Planctomycetota bacterium]